MHPSSVVSVVHTEKPRGQLGHAFTYISKFPVRKERTKLKTRSSNSRHVKQYKIGDSLFSSERTMPQRKPVDPRQDCSIHDLGMRCSESESESESEIFIRSYSRPRRPLLRPYLVAVAEATWKKIVCKNHSNE